MNQCSAQQASCQDECRASIPVWRLLKRRNCQLNCDAQYNSCYAQLIADTEETNTQLALEYDDTIKNVIIIIVAVVVIIFLVMLWLKYRKK